MGGQHVCAGIDTHSAALCASVIKERTAHFVWNGQHIAERNKDHAVLQQRLKSGRMCAQLTVLVYLASLGQCLGWA